MIKKLLFAKEQTEYIISDGLNIFEMRDGCLQLLFDRRKNTSNLGKLKMRVCLLQKAVKII